MKIRPDLVPETERDHLEVIQLTDESIPSSHVYMEAQIFTPDSQRLILHRSAHPHGSDPKDPEHQFLVCNLEDNCSLTPITTELGTTGPSISPDGDYLYYFVNETEPGGGGRLTLKRVGLDGSERESIYVLDHAIPETDFRLSRPYPLSTISSDGRRISISGFSGTTTALGRSGVCSSSRSKSHPCGWSFTVPLGATCTRSTRVKRTPWLPTTS